MRKLHLFFKQKIQVSSIVVGTLLALFLLLGFGQSSHAEFYRTNGLLGYGYGYGFGYGYGYGWDLDGFAGHRTVGDPTEASWGVGFGYGLFNAYDTEDIAYNSSTEFHEVDYTQINLLGRAGLIKPESDSLTSSHSVEFLADVSIIFATSSPERVEFDAGTTFFGEGSANLTNFTASSSADTSDIPEGLISVGSISLFIDSQFGKTAGTMMGYIEVEPEYDGDELMVYGRVPEGEWTEIDTCNVSEGVCLISLEYLGDFAVLADEPIPFSGEGEGTEEFPYRIESCLELQEVSNNLDDYYVLTTDLDCTLAGDDVMIGTYEQPFTGDFDGDNNTITIDIDVTEENNIGLFRSIQNGHVFNLNIEGEISSTLGDNIGGLTGSLIESSVESVTFDGTITATGERIGGLFGQSGCESSISNSYATADITGDYRVGGISGFDACEGPGSSFSEVYFTGSVTADSGTAGGIIGYAAESVIYRSYASSTVSGEQYVGGLIGLADTNITIQNSYARGSVLNTADYSGGLVGYAENMYISKSYAANSEITGTEDVGGLMGSASGEGGAYDSFWDVETSEILDSPWGGEATTTVAMKDSATFTSYLTGEGSWDFEETWDIDGETNDGYPFLLWQTEYEEAEAPVLTEVEGIPSRVKLANARYYFSVSNPDEVEFEYIVSEGCGLEDTVVSPEDGVVIFNGLDVGETYECTLSLRYNEDEYSNELTIGPFTIISASSGGGGGGTRVAIARNVVTDTTIPQVTIAQLQAQLASLMAQLAALTASVPSVRDLESGMEGADVKMLQQLLIAQGYSIPAGATGVFANQTVAALSKYQQDNGITPASGYFGEKTRAQMKAKGSTGLWW